MTLHHCTLHYCIIEGNTCTINPRIHVPSYIHAVNCVNEADTDITYREGQEQRQVLYTHHGQHTHHHTSTHPVLVKGVKVAAMRPFTEKRDT